MDYTPVKYVKKPNGARPGMVTYTTYETAWVTPGRVGQRASDPMTSSPPSCFQSRARFGLSGARSVFKIFHICEMPAAESDRIPFL